MTKLTNADMSFLRVYLRSPDLGDGWRAVSDTVWPFVKDFSKPELLEIGDHRIRLTATGLIVAEYLP